ncbi:MAG: MBL fold metallo-hydrolase [Proteobacteria bacterium]|nr:MBL fold metallo-hydrolase [Pseudomonadota bacterium]
MNPGDYLSRVFPDVYYFDSRMGGSTGSSGVYIIVHQGLILVETGTSLALPPLIEALESIGFGLNDVRAVIVTHVHLDHAGGAGWLVRRRPDLKVYVHPRGAPHLEDPSRLMESAKLVYGDLDGIRAYHGDVFPVPAENVVRVLETTLDLDGLRLEIIDAPGHAPHHLGIYHPQNGCFFAGEALGMFDPDTGILLPAVTPPAFDLEANLKTVDRVGGISPGTICFSHFGIHRRAGWVLEQTVDQLAVWAARLREMFGRGLTAGEIIERLADEPIGAGDRIEDPTLFTSLILGFETYFRRRGELEYETSAKGA